MSQTKKATRAKAGGKFGDETVIPEQWSFKNTSVAENFERHVREQLPWYEMASNMVAHFGRHYLPQNGVMYDLGASTGNITRLLEVEIKNRNITAVSVDYSDEMAKLWNGIGEIIIADVRDLDLIEYDFCVCFLLLMFLPVIDQEKFVQYLLSKLNKGGALIIFDKVEAVDGYLGTVLRRLTIAGKVSSGVHSEDIVAKEMSLAGQQRPLAHNFIDKLCSEFTFEQIFRYGEFAGWVIIR